MAKFTFGKTVDIHWNGYEIVGPALTEFTIPDQLYEEFESDFRAIEPSLTWIDTNEFATLKNSVPNYTIAATSPIAIGSSTNTAGIVTRTWSLNANYSSTTHDHTGVYQVAGNYSSTTHAHDGTYIKSVIGTSPASVSTSSGTATISFTSGTALNGYLLSADGTGGSIWTPASTSGLTSVVGVSPISSVISGGTVSVSLNASYSTSTHDHAGTYQVAGSYSTSTHTHADIPLSTVTAKGNLIAATASSTVSPLPVGTDGQILSASSGAATGLAWIDQTAVTSDNAARIRTLVRNATASTIAKGSVVYLKSSSGLVPTVELALATADATSANTIGIVESDISSNTNGYITNVGKLTALNTSGFADGAALYLSATVAGSFQTAKPTGPSHGVLVGFVIKGGSAGAGEIYVYVKNGSELDEIHDVNITSLANGQALIYSSSASVWQNQALPVSAVIGTSPASVSTASGTSTVSIVAGSINSTHLSATSVGSSQLIASSVGSAAIAAGAVNTSKLSSGAATSGQLLQADGLGAAVFATVPIAQTYVSTFTSSGTWTKPAGVTAVYMLAIGGGGSGGTGGRSVNTTNVPGGGSGGGAAHMSRIMLASQLSATESVTVGAGGIATAAAARTTALTSPIDGNPGGASYVGASWSSSARLSYVGAHGGVGALSPLSAYNGIPDIAPLYQAYSGSPNGSATPWIPSYLNDVTNLSNPVYAAGGGRGGGADSATSDNGVNGAFGMGYVTSGSVPAAGVGSSTAATNGASATTIGGSGAGGGARRNGTAGSFAGNGGNGYIGGGGGGGGSMHSASASCTAGTGGTGGAGLVIIVAW